MPLLRNLFQDYDWETVKTRFLELYPDQEKSMEGYEYVFLTLPTLEEVDVENMRLCISHADNADICGEDEEPDEWEDVHGKNGELLKDFDSVVYVDEKGNTQETTWALEFNSFGYWASMEIDKETLSNYTTLDIVCHSLWEMTFCGFMEETIAEQKAELERRKKEIDDGTAELIPWEEVKERIEKELSEARDENIDS